MPFMPIPTDPSSSQSTLVAKEPEANTALADTGLDLNPQTLKTTYIARTQLIDLSPSTLIDMTTLCETNQTSSAATKVLDN